MKIEINEIISLGPNCHSSGIIKYLNYKTKSYPFDWLLSNTEIILNCLNDNFKNFLDKSLYFKNNIHIGHLLYLDTFFVHRNPLECENDYKYYERTVYRILKIKNSKISILFIHTIYSNLLNNENIIFYDNIKNIINLKKSLDNYFDNNLLIINYIRNPNPEIKINNNYNYFIYEHIYFLNIIINFNNEIEYDFDKNIFLFYKEKNPINEIFNIKLK